MSRRASSPDIDGTVAHERFDWCVAADIDDHSVFRVLAILTNHADSSGLAYPLVTTIAEQAHRSPRRVRDALKALEDQGFIVRHRLRSSAKSSSGELRGWLYRTLIPGSCPVSGESLPPFAKGVTLPASWLRAIPRDDTPPGPADVPAPEEPDAGTADNDDVEAGSPTVELLEAGNGPHADITPGAGETVLLDSLLADAHLQPDHSLANLILQAADDGELDPDLRERITEIAGASPPAPSDTAAVKDLTQQILGYYFEWRSHLNLARPPEHWIGQIRNSLRTLIKREFSPLDTLYALLTWHDLNAKAHTDGKRITAPGGIINAAERNQIAGLRHGINGSGLTERQRASNEYADMLYDIIDSMPDDEPAEMQFLVQQ